MSASVTGKFVWYELMAADVAAAESFYRRVLGWESRDAGLPDRPYTLFSAGGTDVAGAMALPRPAGAGGGPRPAWMGYVWVDDVDACAARIEDAGGAIHRPPADIPGIGRFAVVADPQGAVFALFRAADPGAAAHFSASSDRPGHGGWRELHAVDHEAAFAFYAGVFGWTRAEAVDMGEMGVYQLFASGGAIIGGMMTRSDPAPPPFWLYYFNVDGIDAAAERVAAGGGSILNGPHEVPGGRWIVHAADPEGAMFALLGPR